MAKRPGVTLRAYWMGNQLRELREAAGMTLDQPAEHLQRDSTMISRFENGRSPIRRGDVLALLDLYGVSDERRREDLLRLSAELWRKGWWDGYANAFYDRNFIDFPWLEGRADRIRSYEAMVLPGLVQARDYAETLIRNEQGSAASEEQIQQWVELRMQRQRVLAAEEPTRLVAIVEESALRRPIGGHEVMADQLGYLRNFLQNPSIELRVLPLAAGWHAGLDGAFTLFEMPEPFPDVAYVENLSGRVYVEAPDVENFTHAYDRIYEAALGAGESAELIATLAKEYEDQ